MLVLFVNVTWVSGRMVKGMDSDIIGTKTIVITRVTFIKINGKAMVAYGIAREITMKVVGKMICTTAWEYSLNVRIKNILNWLIIMTYK